MQGDVLIGFVLDKSSSMGMCTESTISGYNEFMKEQRNQPGTALLSLTLFDTSFTVRYTATPLSLTEDLSRGNYHPHGNTALFDAVGVTIKGIEAWQAKNPDFTGPVKVVILTDGEENSSREWHVNHPVIPGDDKDLGGLIDWKQKEGWEFIFLGSGGASWLEKTFSHVVDRRNFHGYDHDAINTHATYAGVSSSMSYSRLKGASVNSTLHTQHDDTVKK
jgi:hypothetical protein